MKFFLKAKHWQLFCLVCGPSFLMPFIFYKVIDSPAFTAADDNFRVAFLVAQLLSNCSLLVFLFWLFSIVWGLRHRLPKETGVKPTLFAGAFGVILFAMIVGFVPAMPDIIDFIPFLLGTTLYCLWSVSAAIVSVEKGRAATMQESVGTAIWLWMFPLGVWDVQPRINALFAPST